SGGQEPGRERAAEDPGRRRDGRRPALLDIAGRRPRYRSRRRHARQDGRFRAPLPARRPLTPPIHAFRHHLDTPAPMLPTMGAALSRREPSVPGSPDRPLAPDQPAETPQRLRVAGPDSARLTDRPADADRPAPWSRPDLRQRLDRLPPGHPSSPDLATQREAAPDAHERSYWNEVPRF